MATPAEEPFCYLTTTGRRTGQPHTIEIWFAASGATLYLMAGGRERADWVRNLVADPAVDVRVGDVVHQATARLVAEGSDEDALARRLLLAKYQKDGELESWGRSALPVALDLQRPLDA
jgi:deazaflavin-dependent oxidoreductase (nitroreductase family)